MKRIEKHGASEDGLFTPALALAVDLYFPNPLVYPAAAAPS
jgi:hypothetical protein